MVFRNVEVVMKSFAFINAFCRAMMVKIGMALIAGVLFVSSGCGIFIEKELTRFRDVENAITRYEAKHGEFPISAGDKISWRVKILPFLDSAGATEQFNLKEAWDSDHNKSLIDSKPKVLGGKNLTSDMCWMIPDDPADLPKSRAAVPAGSSTTIMFLQNSGGVPWTEPKDLTTTEAVAMIKGLKDGKQIVAVFYDGSARRIGNQIDNDILRCLLHPNLFYDHIENKVSEMR